MQRGIILLIALAVIGAAYMWQRHFSQAEDKASTASTSSVKSQTKKQRMLQEGLMWSAPSTWQKTGEDEKTRSVYTQDNVRIEVRQESGDGGGIKNNVNAWRKSLGLVRLPYHRIKGTHKTVQTPIGPFNVYILQNSDHSEKVFGAIQINPDLGSTVIVTSRGPAEHVDGQADMLTQFLMTFTRRNP